MRCQYTNDNIVTLCARLAYVWSKFYVFSKKFDLQAGKQEYM